MKKQVSPTQKALNVWAVILIIWAFYRAKFQLPAWFDEFIAKPIVFILPVLWYIRKYEKKDFFNAIDLTRKGLTGNILLGFGMGALFIISIVLANFIKFNKIFLTHPSGLTVTNLGYIILLSLATAASEEILSRGFILKRLYEESKNIYTSSFFASILFFFLHVPILFTNTKISGNILLAFLVTDMVLSLINSFIFLTRKSLVAPILIHALYSISLMLFL